MREKSVLTLIGRLNNSNCLKSKKSLQPEKFDFIFFFFFSSPLHVLTLHFPQVETERKKERSDPIKTKKNVCLPVLCTLFVENLFVGIAANSDVHYVCEGRKITFVRTKLVER